MTENLKTPRLSGRSFAVALTIYATAFAVSGLVFLTRDQSDPVFWPSTVLIYAFGAVVWLLLAALMAVRGNRSTIVWWLVPLYLLILAWGTATIFVSAARTNDIVYFFFPLVHMIAALTAFPWVYGAAEVAKARRPA